MQIDEKQLKQPEVFVKSGLNLLSWVEKNLALVLTLAGVLIAAAMGVSGFSWYSKNKELQAQDAYYKIEKSVSDKKESFLRAQAQKSNPTPAAAKETVNKVEDTLPTMDLEKDYGTQVAELKAIMTSQAGTKAALMATLTLGQLYSEYAKNEEALVLLEQQSQKVSKDNLLGTLLHKDLGVLLANKGDCSKAISIWSELGKQKSTEFLKDELKLKTAVCNFQLGDLKSAEGLLVELQGQETAVGKSAKKYLRAFKMGAN